MHSRKQHLLSPGSNSFRPRALRAATDSGAIVKEFAARFGAIAIGHGTFILAACRFPVAFDPGGVAVHNLYAEVALPKPAAV